jgi:hypothetical protein
MSNQNWLLIGLTAFVLVLSSHFLANWSLAWEFTLEGSLTWENLMLNQFGTDGFFGKYNADNSSTGGNFASANGWLGGKLNDLTSSSNAARQPMGTDFIANIKINEAVKLKGKYRIGQFGNPISSSYLNSTAPGVNVAISEGQWTMWAVELRTPLGKVEFGKRRFRFGCGLQYNAEEDFTDESLELEAPFGPMTIGVGLFPWTQQPDNPFRRLPAFFNNPPDNPYFNPLDLSAILRVSPQVFMLYESGPWSLGVMARYFQYHMGPESQRLQVNRVGFPPRDIASTDGGAFVKYFDGRLFFNAEVDWINTTTNYQRSQNGTFNRVPDNVDGRGSLFAPDYINAWRWMVEMGAVSGPAKASFMYAWLPGPDRRNGVLIDRQPYFYGFGNFGVFRFYSLILNYNYGSGLGLYNLSTDGYMNDASILAARLDYAIATNLNVWGTFFRADRAAPNGYGWGFIRPAATGSGVVFQNMETVNAPSVDAPSILDGSLGWEVDTGAEWQLLEGWTFRITLGYWQPGRWFNYACVDKTVPNWDVPSAANRFGISPDRAIAPVMGLELLLNVGF